MNSVLSHLISKNGFVWLMYYLVNGLHISRFVPDSQYLRLQYRCIVGSRLNLKNPKTFNEKLQWLKLNRHEDVLSTMVDKHKAKDYVALKIGQEHVIPLLGVWDSLEDIDFSKLPDKFVLKCSHDCGGLVICKDKDSLDRTKAKNKISNSLNKSYYWKGREWPYKNVKPVVFAEQFVEDCNHELNDYKFFCFNGKVKCFKIDFDRFVDHHANYYDTEGKLLPFGEVNCPPNFEKRLNIPDNIEEMIRFAETLAEGQPFARIDFYNVDSKILFGEITLYPASGMGCFTSKEWEYKFGSWIELPTDKSK